MHKKTSTCHNAARFIARRKKYDHITPVLIELHWIPVKFRCEYTLLVYVFKSLHGIAPVYLQDLLTVQADKITAIRKSYENSDTTSEIKVVWCSTIRHSSFYSLEQSSR
jgi:hypothetical protein